MRIPNGAHAIVEIRKLRDYCLNPDNPRGGNKARVFAAALGLTAADAGRLKKALLHAADTEEAMPGESDMYGQRYTIDFSLTTETGSARIRSGWIILHSEHVPRLATCYVINRRR